MRRREQPPLARRDRTRQRGDHEEDGDEEQDAAAGHTTIVADRRRCGAWGPPPRQCVHNARAMTSAGLPQGTGTGQVEYSSSGADSYLITARSKSGCNFLITKANGGAPTRSTTGTNCPAGSAW